MRYRDSLIVLGMLLASCSSSEKPAPDTRPKSTSYSQTHVQRDAAGQPGVRESSTSSTSAVVEAIDQQTRMITLRGPAGNRVTFKAGERVKNLDQIQVGDRVVVDYYESMAIQVVKPGTSADQVETIVDAAEPGEKPGGAAVQRTTMTATIEQIDPSVPSVTLRDQEGNLRTVRVRHPERLKLVKVGDTLRITCTQAVAVSVERAQSGVR